ncbi:cyclase [Microvirga sp. Marseille-Q2068]|uniref:Cyclase n=1 Tax=Microvirga mediterraneensis TaxID=2754695 RepID=A0A838BTZ6_9HYPH|nr:cyclase [Microvirga mediterraneensis]
MKFDARVDFTNGGYVEAKDFLLDIEGDNISPERLAEIIVSAMNLLRAGPVTITAMRIVRRGEHHDLTPHPIQD